MTDGRDHSRPSVHAVVVAYNGAPVLAGAINSLLNDPLIDHVRIVDNGSTDGSIGTLPESSRATLRKLGTNVGFGRGCNEGMSAALLAGADWVLLLNQDATLQPGCVAALLEAGEAIPNAGLLAPMQLKTGEVGLEPNFLGYLLSGAPSFADDLWRGELEPTYMTSIAPNAAAWLLSRHCLVTVGGFDPVFFMYGEDVDLFNRIRFHGFETAVVTRARVVHLRHRSPELDGPAARLRRSRYTLRKSGKAIATLKGDGTLPRRLGTVLVDTAGDVARSLVARDWRAAAGSLFALGTSIRQMPRLQEHRTLGHQPGPHWLGAVPQR